MSSAAFQTSVIAELAAIRAENAALLAAVAALTAAPKRSAKAKAEPSGEPKEKRKASDWILFSSQRVGKIIRAGEADFEKADKSSVGVINQFAGSLWSQKHEWTDDEITAAWADFEPPAVSKQTLEGKSKRSGSSTGSAAAAEPVADAADAPKKERKKQTDETKAAAKLKRAATKAKKEAEAAKPAAASEAEASGSESESDDEAKAAAAAAEIAKAVKKAAKKAKKAAEAAAVAAPEPVAPEPVAAEPVAAPKKAKIAPKPKKELDLLLDEKELDGKKYLTNERNDVLTVDGEWVGRWTGSAIDTSVPEPVDFETLTSRD